MEGSNELIQRAADVLSNGGLVAIPTETVYGLAGNGLSPGTVSRIFQVKNRPSFDPLILHVGHVDKLPELVAHVPELAWRLARAFWPGPLTLLLSKSFRVPDLVTAGSDRVAVRVPDHPLTLNLLNRLDFPLAAPSANPFGYISPTTADHVARQLGGKIDLILDGGPCKVGLESTIVGFENGKPVVYRKGGISIEELEGVAGPVEVKAHSTSNPDAPGMLKSHYAPKVPLQVGPIEMLRSKWKGKPYGILSFKQDFPDHPEEWKVILSPRGDYREAAQRLFAGLRCLDEKNLEVILAELLPEEDLGRAINDRLRRAAAPQD